MLRGGPGRCGLVPGDARNADSTHSAKEGHVFPSFRKLRIAAVIRFHTCLDPGLEQYYLYVRSRDTRSLPQRQTWCLLSRTALAIARPIVPHMVHHTFATEMLRSGVSFPALMNLLGHSTPKMTRSTPSSHRQIYNASSAPPVPSRAASRASTQSWHVDHRPQTRSDQCRSCTTSRPACHGNVSAHAARQQLWRVAGAR